ncbi:hypothetical protein CY34DRAFT_541467 [Suillus luteus UH-Slu-Lm8-n1]|uniref:Uncharacterized protein n=1 Tax=Suillus luteus UH-Slu-Lm8-n1 TaxID=930992 RepID=A0A0D0BGW1_9AGAM|nr:hypothetical protein CY34DRAFT_541467 [Suillus luteus UH-Slu-Lm8-n1]
MLPHSRGLGSCGHISAPEVFSNHVVFHISDISAVWTDEWHCIFTVYQSRFSTRMSLAVQTDVCHHRDQKPDNKDRDSQTRTRVKRSACANVSRPSFTLSPNQGPNEDHHTSLNLILAIHGGIYTLAVYLQSSPLTHTLILHQYDHSLK